MVATQAAGEARGEDRMSTDLIVVGGGEHARVVIDAARSRPGAWNVVGFADPKPCEETARRLRVQWLGSDEDVLARYGNAWFIIGVGAIGVSETRPAVAARYDRAGVRWATVVHSAAWVSESAQLGRGAVVLAGAVVNSGARIGDHCVVNTGAIIEHDVILGAFSQAGPGAAIGGGARVGERCYLGLGCRVRDHVCIGSGSIVGMGAVVVSSVAEGSVMVGIPARVREGAAQ